MKAIIKAVWLDPAPGPLGVHLELRSSGEVTSAELDAIAAVAESPRKLLEMTLEAVDWLP